MIDNEKMLAEIIQIRSSSLRTGRPSALVREMLIEIVDKTINKYRVKFNGKFPDYVDVGAMRDYMLMAAVDHWKVFDPTKSQEPIAFLNMCAYSNIYWFMADAKHRAKKYDPTKSFNDAMRVIHEVRQLLG